MKSALFLLNQYFIENRSRIIDLAAFLDRIENAATFEQAQIDPKWTIIHEALRILASSQTHRVQALQLLLSDPTEEPLDSSDGRKSALGAYQSCC